MNKQRAFKLVRAALTDELRPARYRGHPNRYTGHCFLAAETLWHLLGGQESSWRMQCIPRKFLGYEDTHWYVRNRKTREILDPTAEQFEGERIPYEMGRFMGTSKTGPDRFKPTKRARVMLDRIKENL